MRTPLPRHAETRVREAMHDTRIVALVGPRQSGKTTLVRKIAADTGLTVLTLDDEQTRSFANDDPSGLMRGIDRAVIDEVQRAPALILALKKTVDEDPRPGRFLITGSVELFRSTVSPDSLAGRLEALELLPFSQAEIAGLPPSSFLERALAGDFPALAETSSTPDLVGRVIAGGYPEAQRRTHEARRRAWLTAYARALATRDVADIAEITKPDEMERLVSLAATAAVATVNLSALAAPLGVDGKTVERWLTLLEQMFLIRRVRPWHRNDLKRLVKTPKLHFLDSGLLAALQRVATEDIARDRSRFGALLETFVFSELSKLVAHSVDPPRLSHYRDRDKVEVDFVVERAGRLAGVEVKAAATVKPADFNGLKRLREAAGEAFACGIVLHDGDRIQRVGDRLFAMPVGELWRASG
jgi:predicted AAA+ superfamily ATPase